MTDFDEPGRYDLITAFDAIHDQKSPERVLDAMARALRPGGTFLMQDIAGSSHVHGNLDHPLGALLFTVSCMHCMTVSLAQGGEGSWRCGGREERTSCFTGSVSRGWTRSSSPTTFRTTITSHARRRR